MGIDSVSDGMQSYFAILTSKGQIFTIPIDNINNRMSIDLNLDG